MSRAASYLALLSLATAGSIAACRNNVPPPALPSPVTPELSRDAPKPQPIDPKKKKPAKISMREMPAREVRAAQETPDAAIDAPDDELLLDASPDAPPPPPSPPPVDASVSDVFDFPEVPDAEGIVTDAGTPLR